MIDIKQLQYFKACADAGSFSDAAKILYTTQSNVSKAIRALEDSVGAGLFERLPRGISLTQAGQEVYRYACKILNDMEELENYSRTKETRWLHVSCNPSSWFASRFVEFYNKTRDRKYHFQVYSDSVKHIMERVRDYKDDVGFVYVMESGAEKFRYELERDRLEFVPLQKTKATLYLGEKHFMYGKGMIDPEVLEKLEFVQSYQDDVAGLDVAVVTNSDYIMERMLKKSSAANISGEYLSHKKEAVTGEGISLDESCGQILFGYLKRKKEELDGIAEEFVKFISSALKEES